MYEISRQGNDIHFWDDSAEIGSSVPMERAFLLEKELGVTSSQVEVIYQYLLSFNVLYYDGSSVFRNKASRKFSAGYKEDLDRDLAKSGDGINSMLTKVSDISNDIIERFNNL